MHRMSEWNTDMIRFMEDASSYNSYFSLLARRLSSFIGKNKTVCDAGCGIGQLSLALSPYSKHVTGIDRSRDAIERCERKKAVSDVPNVDFLCTDFDSLGESEVFDVMVFNYFGRMNGIMEIARRHCREKVIIIKKNYREHRFSIGRNPIPEGEFSDAQNYLRSENIPYTEDLFSAEFGQPFRSLEDALLFFSTYSRDADAGIVNIENIRRRLVETDNPEFPFYLPHMKDSTIYIIDRGSYGKPLQ